MKQLGSGNREQVAGGDHTTGGNELSGRAKGSESKGCCRRTGFTLIELLIVIAVIAALAALGISTLGGANKKGAEARARAEVAALSGAIENFKANTGFYPPDAASLYTNLCPPQAGAKVYFEPTPSMIAGGLLRTNETGDLVTEVQFTDPWNNPYGYSNYNNAYFELWSTAGDPLDISNYIRN